jgi:hypothetical protein
MLSYEDYIKSDLWRARRHRFLQERERACEICEATEGPMILHHLFYDRLGAELDSDLVMVCNGCHNLVHRWPHFGPSCVRLMRASWEECGDPSRPIKERELRVRDHRMYQFRTSKGLVAPAPTPVTVRFVEELTDAQRAKYGF